MADLFEQDRLKREGDKLQALVDETNAQDAMRKGQAPPGITMLDDGTAAPGAPPPPAQPLQPPQPQYDITSTTTTRGQALDPRAGLRIMAEQEANAEKRRSAVESIGTEQQSAYAEHEAVQKKLAADQQLISERFGKEGQALSGRLAQLDASLEAQKADLKTLTPQAAATMGTFERVMVSIAAIAEGVRAGATFTPNKAGQIVDQAIERDLGNQRARYAAKLKEMQLTDGQRREIMGRVDQAAESQRTAALQAAQMRLASFASRTDSLSAKMKLVDASLSIDEKLTQSRAEIAQATSRQSTTVTTKKPAKPAAGMLPGQVLPGKIDTKDDEHLRAMGRLSDVYAKYWDMLGTQGGGTTKGAWNSAMAKIPGTVESAIKRAGDRVALELVAAVSGKSMTEDEKVTVRGDMPGLYDSSDIRIDKGKRELGKIIKDASDTARRRFEAGNPLSGASYTREAMKLQQLSDRLFGADKDKMAQVRSAVGATRD